jgi:hypothetical protein
VGDPPVPQGEVPRPSLDARRVAIVCYFLTAFLGLLGWFAVDGGIKRTVILAVGIFAVFVLSALWLGARRGGMKQARYRVQV